MALPEIFEAIILILFIAFFGYKILAGVRSSKKFNREWNNVQDSDKEAFLKNKGNLSQWELGSFTKLPKPLAFIGNLLALAVILFIVLVVVVILSQ
ncbi:hypothetical protein [Pseudoalteromonas sp. SG45-2]|uniref:hypothetical protein n=1 Tax=Pseudoalteromonas sp. SG45-2 TaxID=2760956 RepID=UPI001602FFEB|nr:hypothetical protein [Pseudoalteromonas sp. SG45-2]MBB1346865.1 hypothetical protein [Pseudoalteromonas sp. SG45-2]